MAANINDKITKTFDTVNPNVAKVTADRAPGSTTLQANNLAGWTEVTAEHFSTYRVNTQNKLIEGSQTDWKGIVNKATNTITNLTRVGGAEDSGNLVNDIIQAGPTAKWADDLADGILVTHNADGTLKNKVAALTKINGGSTAGLLKSDASGNVTVGKATSDDLDSATLTSTTLFSASSNTLTFTAPYNCIVEIESSRNTWGIAGGLVATGFNTPSGTTKVNEYQGVTQGHDTQAQQIINKAFYTGLTAGNSYTFSSSIVTGSPGGVAGSIRTIAKCIRVA